MMGLGHMTSFFWIHERYILHNVVKLMKYKKALFWAKWEGSDMWVRVEFQGFFWMLGDFHSICGTCFQWFFKACVHMFDCHETRGQQILWQKGSDVVGTTWIWHLWPRSWEIYVTYTCIIYYYSYAPWLTLWSLDPGYHKINEKNLCFKWLLCIIAVGLRRSQTAVSPPRLLRFRCEDQRAALKIADKLKNLDPKFQEPSTEAGLDVIRCDCQVWVLDVGATWCCVFFHVWYRYCMVIYVL